MTEEEPFLEEFYDADDDLMALFMCGDVEHGIWQNLESANVTYSDLGSRQKPNKPRYCVKAMTDFDRMDFDETEFMMSVTLSSAFT